MTYFANYNFYETMFLVLEGEIKQVNKDITWNSLSSSNFDPRTKQHEEI